MKKIQIIILFIAAAMSANAVPAKRGWQQIEQADGTTVELQLVGDEFCHFWVNRDGQRVREVNGMFEVVGEAPTAEEFISKRNAVQARRNARKAQAAVGVEPNLAPRGVVILANFDGTTMRAAHTQAVFDELCNSDNCTVNSYGGVKYPSAAQYFADQSHGKYRPIFDVYGPVTLSHNYAHYGTDLVGQDEGTDTLATDAVVEACLLANQQYNIDFTQYDSDNDGYVDFVYVIYAGRGQADGASSKTIWPHNWEVESAIYYGMCTYKRSQAKVDGKYINNYAMSAEMTGTAFGGIGTLVHEFGHVMGLPDFYDIAYGTNYTQQLTPNEWDVMDGGAYNGGGHCPPNYSPWEKYFFGWLTPENLGTNGQYIELTANGLQGYKAYQFNASGAQKEATDEGLSYYFENRQKQGWDRDIPAEGLVIWKVDFNANAWMNNTPNGVANKPRYTLVCSNGKKVGASYGAKNVFPYGELDSCVVVADKPLREITKDGQTVSLVYIQDAVEPTITWMANGEIVETQVYNSRDALELPATLVEPCEDDAEIIGWTEEENWADPFVKPEDFFESADGKKVTTNTTYHAVYK
ncbi:MAG: M6 family metalloprotease domain-containing protein [Paludibacteraceae bacterium]|nr:M6 family metalloprotease domain-containing protein [Paludibacteraceae bacterium]